MAGLHVADVSLDTNEEWLVRNALTSYREAIVKCHVSESNEADSLRDQGESDLAEQHSRLAQEWQRTIDRVDALVEKLG